MDSSSLVTGPLLAVADLFGAQRHGGLHEILLDAAGIADLVVDLPTQRPALLRQLLLPVVVDALGRPRDEAEWADWFQAGTWTSEQAERLSQYLEEHEPLLRLLDPVNPFAQVADLSTAKGETKGSGLLVATEATGNNVPLHGARSEADILPLTLPEALRWLVHTHCWDTAAIKTGAVGDPQAKAGKTTGNPVGPLGQIGVTLPVGRNLYETLLLNIPVGAPLRTDDRPQWQRRDLDAPVEKTGSVATACWEQRPPKGLLEVWTWQSRRIRLLAQDTDQGVRVTRVIVAAGDRMPHTPEDEPHTMWRLESQGGGRARRGRTASAGQAGKSPALPRRPYRMQPGKAAWRGLDALLAPHRGNREADERHAGFATSRVLDQAAAVRMFIGDDYPLRVEMTGISYGTQSAVVDDMLFDDLPMPLAALAGEPLVHGAVLDVAGQAEQLAQAANRLSADLRRSLGAEPIPWDKGQRPGEQLLYELDPLVRRVLHGLQDLGDDWDAIEKWREAFELHAWERAGRLAAGLLQQVPVSAYAGRRVSSGTDGKDRTYRASMAEATFWSQRRQILSRAADAHTLRQTGDSEEATQAAMDQTGEVDE